MGSIVLKMSEKPDPDFVLRVPEGDDRERRVCQRCDFVDYVTPKIVVGSVATWEDKILLCRRAIEPRSGFWTLPAGYMEEGESVEVAAAREAQEEARADLAIERVLSIYSIPRISQVQIMFRAALRSPDISAGPESAEVGLFAWEDIPWEELAFPSVHWALNHYRETMGQTAFAPFSNPPESLANGGPAGI